MFPDDLVSRDLAHINTDITDVLLDSARTDWQAAVRAQAAADAQGSSIAILIADIQEQAAAAEFTRLEGVLDRQREILRQPEERA
jgi:hypothetical protein